jgi:hypothetical protein
MSFFVLLGVIPGRFGFLHTFLVRFAFSVSIEASCVLG